MCIWVWLRGDPAAAKHPQCNTQRLLNATKSIFPSFSGYLKEMLSFLSRALSGKDFVCFLHVFTWSWGCCSREGIPPTTLSLLVAWGSRITQSSSQRSKLLPWVNFVSQCLDLGPAGSPAFPLPSPTFTLSALRDRDGEQQVTHRSPPLQDVLWGLTGHTGNTQKVPGQDGECVAHDASACPLSALVWKLTATCHTVFKGLTGERTAASVWHTT